MVDEPRYLARRSEQGYVDTPALALTGEPEAVDEEEQQRQTDAARRRALETRIQRRAATQTDIERELEYHEARCRYLRRELKRLKR